VTTFKRTFLTAFFALLTVAIAFAAGYMARGKMTGDFPLFREAYQLIEDHGLKPLPTEQAIEHGMINGLVQAYGDPFTAFIEPVQTELESNALQGSYGGIGVRMDRDAEGNVLLFPYPDSPAIKAGVQDGDRLLKVEDLDMTPDLGFDQIQAAVRGQVGTTVKIVIGRAPGYSPQEVSIQRAEMPLPSVSWHLEPSQTKLGVIEVNIIAASTKDEIIKAAKDLQSRGATKYALDLRNNGGGLLTAGIDIARLFLKDGDVIQQQYRGQDVVTYKVEKPGEFADIPLVVFVNQNTASAAEIISGAIQAHHRADLIGSQTFGKNTIQLVFSLEDGSSLHITSAHWWIPGIEFPKGERGLVPDVALDPQHLETADYIQAALAKLFASQ
jgi:carboxyl-terminal processing protease